IAAKIEQSKSIRRNDLAQEETFRFQHRESLKIKQGFASFSADRIRHASHPHHRLNVVYPHHPRPSRDGERDGSGGPPHPPSRPQPPQYPSDERFAARPDEERVS